MPQNAVQLGFEGTVDEIRNLLIRQFDLKQTPDSIGLDEPLFSVGVGLTSLEGMELLLELENHFGVKIQDLDWWTLDSPTVSDVARRVIELSQRQQGG